MMFRFGRFAAVACAAAVFVCGGTATAQTQPAPPAKAAGKPAPKPAAAAGESGKTLSMGGAGTGTGTAPEVAASGVRRGIMTRDELRVCLTEEAALRTRLAETERGREPMEAEKAALAVERQGFSEERVAMEQAQKDATAGLNDGFKAFAAKVEMSNARVQAFNEAGKTGSAADRERTAINKEREALDAERKALEAEKDGLIAKLQARVTAYNDKAKVVDQRVTDWNTRNNKANEAALSLEAERKDWVANCSNRRYREEDEMAIKAGK
jgi:hypothetical protein